MNTPFDPASASTLLLPPQFLPPARYYAAMIGRHAVVVDTAMRFNKRFKAAHRTEIADVRGRAFITIPIEKPMSITGARWADIIISDHGHWWSVVLTSLKSAYGRTPFFEYYVDDFLPLFTPDCAGMKLTDYCQKADALVRRLMMLDTHVAYGNAAEIDLKAPVADFRTGPMDFPTEVPYYQVRALQHGFIPEMSILDLLFNTGPESILTLQAMRSR